MSALTWEQMKDYLLAHALDARDKGLTLFHEAIVEAVKHGDARVRAKEHEVWNLEHGLAPNAHLPLFCPRCTKPHVETLTSDPSQPDYHHHVHQCTWCELRFEIYVRTRSTFESRNRCGTCAGTGHHSGVYAGGSLASSKCRDCNGTGIGTCSCSPKTRCDRCGWPLEATPAEGCVVGNCSQRPLPERRSHCAECGGSL